VASHWQKRQTRCGFALAKETNPLWLRTGKRDLPAVASHWQKRPTRCGFALAKETNPLWLQTSYESPFDT